MLQPKRTKFRKQFKRTGMRHELSAVSDRLAFGDYGLKATGSGRITARQIESARRVMTRYVKKNGKMWIRIFPDKPITSKPLEVRQGKGKGAVEYWVAVIRPGKILFEIQGLSAEEAKRVLKLAAAKLHIPMIFTERTVM